MRTSLDNLQSMVVNQKLATAELPEAHKPISGTTSVAITTTTKTIRQKGTAIKKMLAFSRGTIVAIFVARFKAVASGTSQMAAAAASNLLVSFVVGAFQIEDIWPRLKSLNQL